MRYLATVVMTDPLTVELNAMPNLVPGEFMQIYGKGGGAGGYDRPLFGSGGGTTNLPYLVLVQGAGRPLDFQVNARVSVPPL
jgi:hypothetical protein